LVLHFEPDRQTQLAGTPFNSRGGKKERCNTNEITNTTKKYIYEARHNKKIHESRWQKFEFYKNLFMYPYALVRKYIRIIYVYILNSRQRPYRVANVKKNRKHLQWCPRGHSFATLRSDKKIENIPSDLLCNTTSSW